MKAHKKFFTALLAVSVAASCTPIPAVALQTYTAQTESPAVYLEAYRHTIQDFPLIWQMPELPTGCEITALTMALQYYGCRVSKITMASRYLPTASPSFYYGSDGRLYGPDMDNYFVGNPFNSSGYVCGAPALCTAADRYFKASNTRMQAKDITGSTPEQLYALVDQGTPVVVMVTIGMVDRYAYFSWYSPNGKRMSISHNDHGTVLIGYSPTTVTMADPLAGIVTYSRRQFESVFRSRGSQCMILQDLVNKSGYTDVPDNSWFAEAVTYCRDSGLMSGVGNKQFLPGASMTRAMLASVLYRIAGQPEVSGKNPFTDVGTGQWYTDSVLWANETGVASGYGDGSFGTNDSVTREQAVAALWRYAGEPEVLPGADFEDEGDISEYASAAVDWARENGIISGKSSNIFDPKSSMTRAEVAVVLYNYMNLEQKGDDDA